MPSGLPPLPQQPSSNEDDWVPKESVAARARRELKSGAFDPPISERKIRTVPPLSVIRGEDMPHLTEAHQRRAITADAIAAAVEAMQTTGFHFEEGKTVSIGNTGLRAKIQNITMYREGKPPEKSPILITGELIGRGSFKEVYLGYDMTTGKTVAVAQIRLKSSKDRSSTVIEGLHTTEFHGVKGFVQVLGMDTRAGKLPGEEIETIVQPLAAEKLGAILGDNPKTGKPFLGPKSRLKLMAQMCRLMDMVKKKELIHRDLKPDNIFVTIDGDLLIADWGCSMHEKDGSSAGGTPLYMSPETVFAAMANVPDNESRTEGTDIWSVGIIFKNFFRITHPKAVNSIFQPDNQFQILGKGFTFQDPSSYEAGYPDPGGKGLDHLAWKMLRPQPEKRISFEEAAITLKAFSHELETTTLSILSEIQFRQLSIGEGLDQSNLKRFIEERILEKLKMQEKIQAEDIGQIIEEVSLGIPSLKRAVSERSTELPSSPGYGGSNTYDSAGP